MQCPRCQAVDTKVRDSRGSKAGVRRRRGCTACGYRFTTYEEVLRDLPRIRKVDGRREPYQRAKLANSVQLALSKRNCPTKASDALIAEVEQELGALGRREVESSWLGQQVMRRLRALDAVAYVRFASVYRDFDDVDAFVTAVEALHTGTAEPDSERQGALFSRDGEDA